QTTQNSLFFKEICHWTKQNAPHYKIFNTICDATEKRQAEVNQIASSVDSVIVVGGHNSGNTSRLVEIVRQAGRPVQHIETEDELDAAALASASSIGITAGASTPNWIIRKVYRALERMQYKRQQWLRRLLFDLQRTLLLTSIYVAIGAGGLCYACLKLQGVQFSLKSVLIAMLYVLSMHVFNNLTGGKADQYNDPDRAIFYERFRVPLGILAFLSVAAGLLIAYAMGRLPFFILLTMSIAGFSYNLKLMPKGLRHGQYNRIRDIPGSKTVLIAVAWGMVTSIIPALSFTGSISVSAVITFIWATCMVFVRTALFDILDMQGDRIVGRETLPILIGESRTIYFLKILLFFSLGTILGFSALGLITNFGIVLSLSSIFLYIVLLTYERQHMHPGVGLEFLVETHFVMAGLLTLSWSLLRFGEL
ncbi:MAG: UbiA family prenyltransferase, partial [Deltaproteobacteria bacterium]|nr:UbiA family prenyltransferase [Deltaproteobacteria bacterium]